jgi:hypothetical protein
MPRHDELHMSDRAAATAVASIAVGVWVGAVLLAGTYYAPGANFHWDATFEWSRAFALVPSVRPVHLSSVLGWWDGTYIVSVILWWSLMTRPSLTRRWTALGVVTILLFPLNLMGVVAAAAHLLTLEAPDGEYLAEKWPIMQAHGVWFGLAVLAAIRWPRGGDVGRTGRKVSALRDQDVAV